MGTAANRMAALMAALFLSGCTWVPSPVKDPIVVNGNSQFTESGIEAMKASRTVSFDFTSPPMDMSALGFAEGSDGALVATDTDQRMKVSMTTPNGVVEMETDTIRVRPGADNIVDHIDIFINYPDAQDANQEIRRASDELGTVLLQDAEPIGADFTDGSGKEQWYPGMGNKTGTVFSAEILSNHDTGRMTFIYSAHLAGKYYTPDAKAGIASTGKP
ncbi:hypothetical protein [Arthrobacter oryzae]|uniref:hypothetical protein n=1 Tax=Arthrobacter oryzae TaxID=409290 RepID=UPI002864E541|nr:hypothetical protein [Arthrobacter oryzae]MDR6504381.1 hypothetical protein [Arthrobacter oryzae]